MATGCARVGWADYISDGSKKQKTQTVISYGTVMNNASAEEGQVYDDAEEVSLWLTKSVIETRRTPNNSTDTEITTHSQKK